jgi:hypothetical protein
VTVRELLASIGDQPDDAEIFVVTSSDGTHIDGKVEVAHVEELPLLGGAPVLAVIPHYAVLPTENKPMLRLGCTEETQPAA